MEIVQGIKLRWALETVNYGISNSFISWKNKRKSNCENKFSKKSSKPSLKIGSFIKNFILDISRRFVDNATNSYSRSRSCLQRLAQCWLWNRLNLCFNLASNVENCRGTVPDKSIRNVRNSIFPVWDPNFWFQLRWSENSTTEMRSVSSFLLMFNFINCNSSGVHFFSTQ